MSAIADHMEVVEYEMRHVERIFDTAIEVGDLIHAANLSATHCRLNGVMKVLEGLRKARTPAQPTRPVAVWTILRASHANFSHEDMAAIADYIAALERDNKGFRCL